MTSNPLTALWRLYKDGLISFEELRTARTAITPQCRGCGAEPLLDAQTGLGFACYAAMAGVRTLPTGDNREVWK